MRSKNKRTVTNIANRALAIVTIASFALCAFGCRAPQTPPSSDADAESLLRGGEAFANLVKSIKCIIPAPPAYKKLWLDINATDNSIGRALMAHYMGCSGKTFRLSESEFKKLPVLLVMNSASYTRLSKVVEASRKTPASSTDNATITSVDETMLAATGYGNTLGHFSLELKGVLKWKKLPAGETVPYFEGKTRAKDRYDFNPGGSTAGNSWRSTDSEIRVRIAHAALPGMAFDVETDWINFNFKFPQTEGELIQDGYFSGDSGYSDFGQQIQIVLMTELRSDTWNKATEAERIGIILRTMVNLQKSTVLRHE